MLAENNIIVSRHAVQRCVARFGLPCTAGEVSEFLEWAYLQSRLATPQEKAQWFSGRKPGQLRLLDGVWFDGRQLAMVVRKCRGVQPGVVIVTCFPTRMLYG